jgi:hypothetical protein
VVAEDRLTGPSHPAGPGQLDTSAPNLARVWNYLIGGRDNFEADRRAARQLLSSTPLMQQAAVASRAFLRRTVTYLAAEQGVRQFLDIGTGLPSAGNTHEVARAVDRSCRVVLVDNDPVVLSHARARLRSTPPGATSYLHADARDTGAIMDGAGQVLDLAKPVGVIMVDILNFLEDATEVLARLVAAVPAGSYLAIMQPANDPRLAVAAHRWNRLAETPVFLRDRDQVARWLRGLQLIEPGIVEVHRWRPAPGDRDFPDGMPLLGAVARKP